MTTVTIIKHSYPVSILYKNDNDQSDYHQTFNFVGILYKNDYEQSDYH